MYFRSFQAKLFLSVGGIFLLFVFLFTAYQYTRERAHKVDTMHMRLQTYNHQMAHALGDSITSPHAFHTYVEDHFIDGLRVTIIDQQGRVLMDNLYPDYHTLPNHRDRKEVTMALLHGEGYDMKRRSESTNDTYFYSATLVDGRVVRTAMPYDSTFISALEPTYTFLWYALFITLMLGIVLYRSTSRIARHIGYLREFAIKANNGDQLDHELERKLPDDELGDISHTIITLFWKLRHSEDDKQRLKHQLTQNAAHELKTPAASISGYLESIVSNPDMPEQTRQHFIERCYTQSQRMCRLLQDMTTLTRMDEVSVVDSPADLSSLPPISVHDVVRGIVDELEMQFQEKGISADILLPEHISVRCEKGTLYSIFRNLTDNALAYADGATTIKYQCEEILSSPSSSGKQYLFSVSDNGCGIEPRHLSHIFERFYRVDKGRSRKLGGTGLGLAIVKNSVALYGGTTTAHTTPGGGLTVSFTLSNL